MYPHSLRINSSARLPFPAMKWAWIWIGKSDRQNSVWKYWTNLETSNERDDSVIELGRNRPNIGPERCQPCTNIPVLLRRLRQVVQNRERVAILRVHARGVVVAIHTCTCIPQQFIIGGLERRGIRCICPSEISFSELGSKISAIKQGLQDDVSTRGINIP